jgi:hypothetical protein
MEFRGPKALVNLHGCRQTFPDKVRIARHSDNNGMVPVAKRPAAAFGLHANYPTLKIRLDTGVDRMTDV